MDGTLHRSRPGPAEPSPEPGPTARTSAQRGICVATFGLVLTRIEEAMTGERRPDGATTLAYSGDTEWTDALLPVAKGADLFIVECYEYERTLSGHMRWLTIKERLKDFAARQVMLTHMNPNMLARIDEARQSGVLIAEDGLTLDL